LKKQGQSASHRFQQETIFAAPGFQLATTETCVSQKAHVSARQARLKPNLVLECASIMTVITRFAPSPTGMLHIGGARTALFNYLFARRHSGRFLLRVEDTDKARSTEEASQAILEGLAWLGLNPDAPVVFQSQQADRHRACAYDMLERGTAFKCYVTPGELQARRAEGENHRAAAKVEEDPAKKAELLASANALLAPFRSPWRDGGTPPSADAPFTVRLRAPEDGDRMLTDLVQGEITIQANELDDLIMLRADGTPTYMLAVVIDDHDMGVTHIIRGDDHLRNAFRQIPIYEAMGWTVPEFAHVPLIHGPDGAKLSKRHGALSTLAYRDMGYLPEAMNAYLLRLGWSHGDQEIFTQTEAIEAFELDGIGKSPARLDFDKLGGVNAHFIQQSDDDRLFDDLLPYLQTDRTLTPEQVMRVQSALPEMKVRGDTLPNLADSFQFLLINRPIELNKKARKSLREEGLVRLTGLRDALIAADDWSVDCLSTVIHSYCTAQDLSMGQVGQPLRAALTGGLPAPDIAPVLAWLGRDEAIGRIDDQI
jgi:glutamyl-tRNA synthetase